MKTSTWISDPAHSSVEFQVKHLTISTLVGRFTEIECTVEAADNFESAKFTFTANISSIATYDEKRDAHLKSADFFDAGNFPRMTFVSTAFTKTGENVFELKGDLTIRGVTKPVSLVAKYGGTVEDNYGNTKAGFEITGKINRTDYGLVWNMAIEAGGFLVGDQVKIAANIELLKK